MARYSEHRAIASASYPIHVILGAYPLACFTGAFVTDLVYARSYNMQWANFSVWLITSGLVVGALAMIVGLIDFLTSPRARTSPGWWHGIGTGLVMLLSLWNVFVHSRDAYTSVMPTGLILSAIVSLLVLVTSWLGTRAALRRFGETGR